MRFALVGYGRMGKEIERIALERGHQAGPRFDRTTPIVATELEGVDVAFEFTGASSAAGNVGALIDAGVAVVCGTTGWRPDEALRARAAAAPAGVVIAPNFSVGMNLFYRLVRDAARLLGGAGLHDPYVWEMHHRGKRDAPSGTARRLAEIVREADPRVTAIHEGTAEGGLAAGALHVVALRAGTEPGAHTVGWDGAHDRIELAHVAHSRGVFALGAVLAAEWMAGCPGLHSFDALLDRQLAG